MKDILKWSLLGFAAGLIGGSPELLSWLVLLTLAGGMAVSVFGLIVAWLR